MVQHQNGRILHKMSQSILDHDGQFDIEQPGRRRIHIF
jgi:hypothetical protein